MLLASFCCLNNTPPNRFFICNNDTNNNNANAVETLNEAYKKHDRVYVHSIKTVLEQYDEELVKNNCGLLVLQCCGTLLADQTPANRQALCEQVWTKLKELKLLNVSYYNTYIQICIENNTYLSYKEFLNDMKCEANEDTYKLLLRCVCEFGDTHKAVEILSIMKEKLFVVDEHVFTSLVLGHAIKGGLKEVMPVLRTMQTAHVQVSPVIINSIIRGLVLYSNKDDFLSALQQFPLHNKDYDLVQLMMVLGQTDNHSWLDNIIQLTGPIEISKQNIEEFNLMCVRLIHIGKADVALRYYKKFVDRGSVVEDGNYAFFLLVEMLISHTPTVKIIKIIKELKDEGLNLIALEKLTVIAVKKGLFNVAWELLMTMSHFRPHYFWPFLLHSSKQQGEIGVLNTLEKMIEMEVRPDVDTLEYYCMHLCDTSDPKQLIMRLQNLGLSMREILTPLLAYLLRLNKIEAACGLSQAYNTEISTERLVKPLIKAWVSTKDASNTSQMLKRMSSNCSDSTGQFLIKILRYCNSSEDAKHYLNLIKAIKRANLNISLTVADVITNRLKQSSYGTLFKQTETLVNNLSLKTISSNSIPHPRQMNLTELENHLLELENKQMETRGVLRRLISGYYRIGDYKKVFELRDKVLRKGYEESPGMKTSIMHAYVLNNDIYDALKVYSSIKNQHPNFVIDEFKIVDLAAVLVKNKQLNEAINILCDEANIRQIQGGSQLVRNCWELIRSGHNEEEVQKLFDVLVQQGYCKPGNIVLGPLVKLHLKNGDLEKAVSVFKKYTEKYNCTPLQLELLSALVKNENLELLQETLNCCSKVHGYEATIIPAVAAFAQNGLHKPLKKFLLEMKGVNKKDLEKRCERWVNENMVFPLETLAQASYSLPSNLIDKDVIYYSIMKLHSVNNDCEAAVSFYRELIEKESTVSKKTTDELLRLTQRCNLGMCSSSAQSIKWILQNPNGGNLAAIIIGGVAEALHAEPNKYRLVLKNRKGFIKIALKTGSPLVPVFSFGETDIYNQFRHPLLQKFQYFVKAIAHIAPIIPIGRGFLQYSFGLVPERKPLTTVFGSPIQVRRIENPTPEEINEFHKKFIDDLVILFEENKHKYINNADNVHLEIL
ncbi:hypothetical protein RN001_004693 [Aquatica leii]|uniref:Uncharacterized protein n=1 Tax=Aquatica leii TaxID=1421715 RepID=A0AAN7PYU0_9COLE|nr:hypothetical protein RN001_004693 [Aquatica leii]